MATTLSFPCATPNLRSRQRHPIFRPNTHGRVYKLRCSGENSTSNSSTKPDTEPQNVLLKMAWYSSELLGIAASFFRSPSSVGTSVEGLELSVDGSGAIDRAVVVETIKEDFQSLTLEAYEEDCEFADPAGSFRGLRRFKRNCTNFGSLVDKSDMKLMKWEDLELLGTQNTILMHKLEKYAEGVCYAKKDYNLAKHPEIDVPNLQVIKLMQSFKSKEYVRETFAWMHYYWYLTNDGIEFLRTYLNLPSEIVPNTLKRAARPPPAGGRFGGPPGDRPRGPPRAEGDRPRFSDREGYRGGARAPTGEYADKGGAPAEYQPAFRGTGGRSGFGRGGGGGSFGAGPAGGSFE
ncbi:hypothetical protein RHMOL_Rhmol07G0014000 [Rhododendron molle]|uniref:Uncharacterized protein n=1 Tax=Rhododendron molle TaxID=49168 RepID=A0ACC0MVY1_RHOML|nr:hypothetical protein RHMOL_Rhmol07G0014000 [Rhododendron molle]